MNKNKIKKKTNRTQKCLHAGLMGSFDYFICQWGKNIDQYFGLVSIYSLSRNKWLWVMHYQQLNVKFWYLKTIKSPFLGKAQITSICFCDTFWLFHHLREELQHVLRPILWWLCLHLSVQFLWKFDRKDLDLPLSGMKQNSLVANLR